MANLYEPCCTPCDEDGDITQAVHTVHSPWGTTHLCAKHFAAWEAEQYQRSGEPDYGAVTTNERMDAAYAVDRGQK